MTDLLSAQSERKDKLRTAIQEQRVMLADLQTEILQLRGQIMLRSPFPDVSLVELK